MASRSLGTLTLDLIAKTGGFEQGMDRAARTADKRMREIEKGAKRLGTFLGTALAAGATAAATGLVVLTKAAIDQADQFRDLSIQTGLTTETLSAYAYAASQTGTDVDSLARGLKALSKNIAEANDPTSKAAKLFEALGVTGKDFETVLPQIADGFAQLEDGATKAALAQELFGKAGVELTEFLNQGASGIAEFTKRAEELGLVIDTETANAADEFNDSLADLKAQFSGLGIEVAQGLLPTLKELVGDLSDLIKQGDLAANVTTLIASAASAGVGALEAYNNAVARVSIGLETISRVGGGAYELLSNLSSLGIADGSFGAGLARIRAGLTGGQAQLDDLIARQNAPRATSDGIDFTRPAPADPAASGRLRGALSAALGGGGGSAKRAATKATKELTEAEKAYQDVMEVGLLIDEQVDDYRRDQIQLEYRKATAIEDGIASANDQIEAMQFELELMGLTNAEREKAIALRQLDANATDEQKAAVAELAESLRLANEKTAFVDDFRAGFAGAFTDIVTGAKSAKDAIRDFLDSFAARITQLIAERLVERLFGSFGSTGAGTSGGNIIGSIFGAFFGGGRATGGATQAGRMYRVNEYGPEMYSVGGRDYLLAGGMGGNVTPYRSGGGGSITQQFYTMGTETRRTGEQKARQAGREARRALGRTGG